MISIADSKITIAEFIDMDFEESYAEENGEVEFNILIGFKLEVANIFS